MLLRTVHSECSFVLDMVSCHLWPGYLLRDYKRKWYQQWSKSRFIPPQPRLQNVIQQTELPHDEEAIIYIYIIHYKIYYNV